MEKELLEEKSEIITTSTEPYVPVFGQEILREFVLQEILGKEGPQILYWAGKQLARKFPVDDFNEILNFFTHAGWGALTLKKETKHGLELELSGEVLARRFELNDDCHFQLEAGFLAQQIEMQKKRMTETLEEKKKKLNKVLFTVQWDSKDILE
ncbi:YslB family protein [Peribacillus acanthi]|uniref:YslB family protein n=1 Tax=Peribacillus acanthi TaxID=2171554 RepID=UPI000D3E8FAF|nr:YslB family protein [Peribacillus acanthi]